MLIVIDPITPHSYSGFTSVSLGYEVVSCRTSVDSFRHARLNDKYTIYLGNRRGIYSSNVRSTALRRLDGQGTSGDPSLLSGMLPTNARHVRIIAFSISMRPGVFLGVELFAMPSSVPPILVLPFCGNLQKQSTGIQILEIASVT